MNTGIFLGVLSIPPPRWKQTLWFMESVLSEIIFIFSIRSHLPFFKAKPPALPLWLLSLLTIIFTISALFSFLSGIFSFARPSSSALLTVFLIVLSYFAITEIVKVWYYKFRDTSS